MKARESILAPALPAAQAATICCASTSRRRRGNLQAIEVARTHAAHERRAFHQFIERGGENAPLGDRSPPSGPRGQCAAARRQSSEWKPIWQTKSTKPISIPSSSDAVATSTRTSPAFSLRSAAQAQFARKAPVVRGHGFFPQTLGQMVRHSLGKPPRIDEHQRRTMPCRTSVAMRSVNFAPHLV